MSVSSQTLRCFSSPLSSSSAASSSSYYQCPRTATHRFNRCSRSASVQEALIPPQIEHKRNDEEKPSSSNSSSSSGIQVPRQKYLSVSKSELLDAIVSEMLPSPEEAPQFHALSQCLDSILHAEHKTILEEMRGYYDDLTPSTKTKAVKSDEDGDFAAVAGEDSESEQDETDSKSKLLLPLGFTIDFNSLLDFSSKRNFISTSRLATQGRFQRTFMKLLDSAEFKELSPRDLMLTSALNTDYLLTLPIYIDWKRASESSAIIFRRGYTTERQKGLLIAEKLDYLQSKFLQSIIFLIAKPLGRLGVWLDENSFVSIRYGVILANLKIIKMQGTRIFISDREQEHESQVDTGVTNGGRYKHFYVRRGRNIMHGDGMHESGREEGMHEDG